MTTAGTEEAPGRPATTAGPASPSQAPVVAFVALLGAAAALVAVACRDWDAPSGGTPPWVALVPITALVVAAEYLFVQFRYRGEVNGLNLMEAVLAPLIVAFPPAAAIATVAAGQTLAAVARRNAPVKGAFNVAQWSLAAAAGSAVAAAVQPGRSDAHLVAAVLAALLVVAACNQAAFTLVLSIVNRQRVTKVLAAMRPVILPGWGAGWALNSVIGLLFVFAFEHHPVAVLIFPVPLLVLHLAYRGYAGARTDRLRLTGLHRAAGALASALRPEEAVPRFLAEVARAFEARAAALVLAVDDGLAVHTYDARQGAHAARQEARDAGSITSEAMRLRTTTRVTTAKRDPLRVALAASGWRDALVAPLVEDGEATGAIVVFDQGGLEGFEAGEVAVLEALARETAGTLARGRLLDAVLEERRTTREIVESTSDGILTLDDHGAIRTWNRALEQITGFTAAEVVGRPVGLVLRPTLGATNQPLALERWTTDLPSASRVQVIAADGTARRLSCSYGRSVDDGRATLVVIARDLTPADRFEELRQELGRLVEVEAAHREVVAALQDAMLPAAPTVTDTELAVAHVPSDAHSPTGGDLYDWQLLPDGTVHVAVTDVIGHGVTATKHALAVISTLRLLALQGCPLEEMVARADGLLRDQDPDLVATLIVARYDPRSGAVRLAAGGHPPALLISPGGETVQLSAPGCAIGWPYAGSEVVVEAQLEPGDSLVLYTDGLVEARRNILEGLDALVAHASQVASRPAPDLVRELVDRALAGAERSDDSLALVVRRLPRTHTERPVEKRWTFPAGATVARDARRHLREWMTAVGVEEALADDMILVASELVTNAAQAGSTSISISAVVGEDSFVLDVTDDGHGDPHLDERGLSLPRTDVDHGRGLLIARQLTDDVSIMSTAEGTAIRTTRSLVKDSSGVRTHSG